jgi:hypothetical protein
MRPHLLLWLFLAPGVVRAAEVTEGEVVQALRKLGSVSRDKDRPGYSVTIVVFRPGPKVTDATLVNVKALKTVEVLSLPGANVTDKGLAHIRELHRLKTLGLARTRISNAGLARLEGLKLEHLFLNETKIDDGGVKYLKKMKSLTLLSLTGTKVSDAGVRMLRKSLPGTRIAK